MNFLDLAKQRYSARDYATRKVEEEKIQHIVDAGCVAPTAANKQPQHILVLREEESLQRLGKAAKTYGAPLAFLVCVDRSVSWVRAFDRKSMADIDASIVTTHMMLEAADLGLGSCWIAQFNPVTIREEFFLPNNLEPSALLLVGYANGAPASPNRHATMRKPQHEMVSYESFQEE